MSYIHRGDIAKILDTSVTSVYLLTHPDKKKEYLMKINENYKVYDEIKNTIKEKKFLLINLNELVNKFKTHNFNYISQGQFEIRLMVLNQDIVDDLGEFIQNSAANKYIGLSRQMLITRVNKNKIRILKSSDLDFPEEYKEKVEYLFNKDDCINNIPLSKSVLNEFTIVPSKQFFTTEEVVKYLKNVYNYNTYPLMIKRKIEKGYIKAIQIDRIVRIPILEFFNLDHDKVFHLDRSENSKFNKDAFIKYYKKYVNIPSLKTFAHIDNPLEDLLKKKDKRKTNTD